MTVPMLTVTPAGAAQAYASVAGGSLGGSLGGSEAGRGGVRGRCVGRAMEGVVQSGHEADAQAMKAIAGGSNFTEVATAVSRAELALQSAVAIRDKVVSGVSGRDADADMMERVRRRRAALREALWLLAKLGGPLLVAALVVGLLVSLVQAVTQINEPTLVFLPKLLVLGAAMVLLGPFMTGQLNGFTHGADGPAW